MARHDLDDDSSHAIQEAESALEHDELPTPLRQQLQLTVAMYRDMLNRERQRDIAGPRGMHMPTSGSGGISGWHLVGHTAAILTGIGSFLILGITLTNHRIDDLAQRVGSMDQRMGSSDQRLGSMDKRLGSMDESVTSLDQSMASLDQEMNSLDRKVTSLDHSVTSLDRKVTSLDHSVTSLDRKVTSLDGRVSSVEGGMEVVQVGVSETRALVSAIAAKLDVQPSPKIR